MFLCMSKIDFIQMSMWQGHGYHLHVLPVFCAFSSMLLLRICNIPSMFSTVILYFSYMQGIVFPICF